MTSNGADARRHAYWRLLQKELVQSLPMVIAFTLVLLAWYAFLYTRTGRWSGIATIMPLSLLPFGFIGPWTLWRCVATLQQEWTGNHMHLLLALPVPGWYVTSTKALTVLLEAAWYSLICAGGFRTLLTVAGVWSEAMGNNALSTDKQSMILTVVLFVLALASKIIIVQCSYIVGRMVNRFRGFVATAAVLVSGWLVFRVGLWIEPWFRWLPPVRFRSVAMVDGVRRAEEVAFFSLAPAAAAFCVVLVLFWLGSVLLERDVEL